MASPHFNVSIVSRSTGGSAVASAAYRHAARMRSDLRGEVRDYSEKAAELAHSELSLPENAPGWAREAFGEVAFGRALAAVLAEAGREVSEGEAARLAWARVSQALWNSVEEAEERLNRKRATARLARSLTIALPRVLGRETQIELMRGYVASAFASRGMVADWVIHDKGDGNPHAHVMLTLRDIGDEDWGRKNRAWNRADVLAGWRKGWQAHANLALERAGFSERVDLRSLEEQGLDLAPEGYNPHVAEHAERVGDVARERMRCSEVRERNRAYLVAHPEHIIAVVQMGQAQFTKGDLLEALAVRLGVEAEGLDRTMVAAVEGSDDLVPLVARTAGGDQLYISRAKAEMAGQLARDATALAEGRLKAGVVPEDPFETGTGPVLVDIEREGDDEDGRHSAGDEGRGGAGGSGRGGAAGRGGAGERGSAAGGAQGRGPSAAVVREALSARAEDLFRSAFGEPARSGAREWRAKENAGLAMQMQAPRRGLWHDHTAGTGGDLLDLVAVTWCGLGSARDDFPKVLEEAARFTGVGAIGESDAFRARAAKRAKQVAAEGAREGARRAALVRRLAEASLPVEGTPAAAYLASRGITDLPGEGIGYLPPVPGAGVLHRDHGALVVWARDDEGRIQGGQRILIDAEGGKAAVEIAKPSFGAIAGLPARLPARAAMEGEGWNAPGTPGSAPDPLIIAEGPESALSIWAATGCETWAVFGVSGWKSAPVPLDREVILAPDRDAADSPAGRAFRAAVAHHLGRGCRLRVAVAPEETDSKRDLNDTHRRAGAEAVRAAIAAAREVVRWLPGELNAGQRDAAEAMLGPDRLTLVKGHAGTGKTFTLGAVAEAWQSRGVRVLAGAPSAKATQALGEIAGIEAATLAAWESRWARGEAQMDGPFVFLMDEAGMVGLGQWSRIGARVAALGGKLIAVGDPDQLQPVSDLSGWQAAEREAGAVPVMDMVIRQKDAEDRTAVAGLARGGSERVAGLRHFMGAVEPLPPSPEVARLWEGSRASGETCLAVAPSNPEVWALNDALRAVEIGRGWIDTGHTETIHIRRWQGEGKTRRSEVVTIPVAPGDRVMLMRENDEDGIAANSLGTIAAVSHAGLSVRFDGMADPVIFATSGVLDIDYGYAATGWRARGMAVDHALVTKTARSHRPSKAGRVTEIDPPDAVDGIAAAWAADMGLRPEAGRIALAATNADVRALNDAIRARLRAPEGAAGEDPLTYQPDGMRIVIERVDRSGVGSRQRVEIVLSPGDRVMLTRPLPEFDLPRSGFGTVLSVGPGRLRLAMDGREAPVEIDPTAFPHLDYGYAATVHKSQGMTVDESYVLPHRRMDCHSVYVALSRHRERVRVFARSGHLDRAEQLIDLGQRSPDAVAEAPRRRGIRSMVPLPARDILERRPDWTGPGHVVRAGDFAGDRHLMSVGTRIAGLLAADHAGDDPLLVAGEDPGDYTREPTRVIDDLVRRNGVIRAEEVAGVLARQVSDPETFLRLFREAMAHKDLVSLPASRSLPGSRSVEGGDDAARDEPWVYTTGGQLGAELAALDRGMRLAAADPGGAETGDVLPEAEPQMPDTPDLSGDQRRAVAHAQGAGGVRIIEGPAGSGKTRVAAALARAEREAGRVVTVVAPTAALAAEGVEAITPGAFFSDPVLPKEAGSPARVVILDDAQGLGIDHAEVMMARCQGMGAKLVALVNPERRGVPVFRTLGDRIGRARLTGLHGVSGPHREIAEGLRAGGGDAERALRSLADRGHLTATGTAEAALGAVAKAYVSDRSSDRLALAWSRADADRLTEAIRARLDATDPGRAAFVAAEHGGLKGLKPGDIVRFPAAGAYGRPSVAGKAGSNLPAEQGAPIRRGDVAEVLGAAEGGGLRLRLTGVDGTREIAVAPEGPGTASRSLPPWRFAFASTIAAASGRRHESVHVLLSPAMDREVVSTAALVSRARVSMALPVDPARLDAALAKLAARERLPRSVLDHGFDPGRAAEAAGRAGDQVAPPAVKPAALSMEDPEGLSPVEVAALTTVPTVSRSRTEAARANRVFLKAHPDHAVVIVAADRPVFTEADLRQALRARLGQEVSEARLRRLGDRAMRSKALLRLERAAPDGSPQYMTTARAALARDAARDARALAGGRFAPGDAPVLRPDALEALNHAQRLAAEAMLDDARLTLVQGHAGTGKTFALRAAAEAWTARGVRVLAGAPSGKAVSELEGIEGVEAATLAAWEARWARGEGPAGGGFVFIMDEAGMVGAGAWSRIQGRIRALGGKLIAVGDPDQLQPVSDIPGWAIAERASGAGAVVIDTVRRQSDMMDAQATEALARGGDNAASAIGYYDGKGALRLAPEVLADPVGSIARDYYEPKTGSRIALAYTNRDVHALNDCVRAEALARGIVDPASLRHYGTITREQREGAGVKTVRVPLEIGVGERIMLTAPHPELGLARSSFGTVTRTGAGEIAVRFDGREEDVTLDPWTFRDIDYGYAATVHKSQGMTADAVFVLPHRQMHRHAAYVALSRHREHLAVYGRVGHMECAADLVGLAQAAGHLDMDLPADAERPPGGMVPGAEGLGLSGRADWRASGVEMTRTGFAGDAELMGIAERRAGLMAGTWRRGGDPVAGEDPRGYARHPHRVIDDLIARGSVIRAEDVADRLARAVSDPETFLRLFRAAMSHPDLIALGERQPGPKKDDGSPRARVYTTRTQLEAELDAVDRGVRLALAGAPERAPRPARMDRVLKVAGERLDPDQVAALGHALAPGRLRLVRGGAGSGKTRVAGEIAAAYAAAGWQVLAVAPGGAGLDSLRDAGVARPRTLARFLGETEGAAPRAFPGSNEINSAASPFGRTRSRSEFDLNNPWKRVKVTLDPATVVILDDAGRLGGREATELLGRIEASGAKLVACLDEGTHVPPEAGPVFRALETRVGAARLVRNRRHVGYITGVLEGLEAGGARAEAAAVDLDEIGLVQSVGTAREALRQVARDYVEDGIDDRIALAWSRADADRLTRAIRAEYDRVRPERAAFAADEAGPLEGLRPQDRIRFMGSTPWVPVSETDAPPRLSAGETAVVLGRDGKTGGLVLAVGEDPGEVREVVLGRDMEGIPEWRFAFAGTIHGEMGRARGSVHLLAARGMNRQVLASAIALHEREFHMVAPCAQARVGEMLLRIARRDAGAESVLDYGFDPALGAREALRGHSGEPQAREDGDIAKAMRRFREMTGLGFAKGSAPLSGGVGAEVLAEVLGAAALREGAAPAGADRGAVEEMVRTLSDPRAWRKVLRQLPGDVPAMADREAERIAGADHEGRLLSVGRMLARGAVVAAALGEDRLAGLFRDGLTLYGKRAEMARAEGRLAELVPGPVAPESFPDPRVRAEAERAKEMRRSRPRRGRSLFAGVRFDASDEQVAREALALWGLGPPARAGTRPRAYAAAVAERREVRRKGVRDADLSRARSGRDIREEPGPERIESDVAAPDYVRAAVEGPGGPWGVGAGAAPGSGSDRVREDLALVLAMAISRHVPLGDAVHKDPDLAKSIARMLDATGYEQGEGPGAWAARAAEDGPPELAAAVGMALNAGPLPDADALRKERADILGHLTGGGERLPEDLVERMGASFTQSEIWALYEVTEELPSSLPVPDAAARANAARHLGREAARRQGPEHTQQQERDDMAETETRSREDIRHGVLGAMLVRNVTQATFDDLGKGFTFREIQALKNPEMALPESLPEMTAADRKSIAAALEAGPPKPETQGAPAEPPFVPDPKYIGMALQLAVAITERVDGENPVHRRDLVRDIQTLLKAADRAETLPQERVNEVAMALAKDRVTLETKLALGRKIDGEKFDALVFRYALSERNTEGTHPLQVSGSSKQKAYDTSVGEWLEEAFTKGFGPTQTEVTVARVASLPDLPQEAKSVVEAMKRLFRAGSIRTYEGIRKDRLALLGEIADVERRPNDPPEFLARIYRNFTHREVLALTQPDSEMPATLPEIDAARRADIAQGLKTITNNDGIGYRWYAWCNAAKSLGMGLNPERSRSRGMGRGM